MQVQATAIPEVKLITPKRFGDHRGFFSETYNARILADAGIDIDFVQDNQSLSAEVGTIRGLHFQTEPFAQAKLVRVVRGAILDVAVDLRKSSPTFGKHVGAVLSQENWQQLYIPVGFAHGFCTIEPNTEVIYKVSDFYSAPNDRGLLWNDPALAIDWPLNGHAATLSEKDKVHPVLAELGDVF